MFSRILQDRFTLQFVLRLLEVGKRIVWDLDDDLMSIPDWSPVKKNFPDAALSELQFCLRSSDAVTVSTGHLKRAVAANFPIEPERITVLENLIDANVYNKFRNPYPPGHRKGPIRVLWTGSSSHVGDVGPFIDLYGMYRNDPRFRFITYGHLIDSLKDEPIDRFLHIGWGHKKFYEGTLASLAPSVSIVPIADCRFNRSKSAIKFYESTLAGAVTIASKLPPYSDVIIDEVTGFLVDPLEGWESVFSRATSNPWVLSQVQQNASDWVRNHYSWNVDNPRRRAWVEFFHGLPTLRRAAVEAAAG